MISINLFQSQHSHQKQQQQQQQQPDDPKKQQQLGEWNAEGEQGSGGSGGKMVYFQNVALEHTIKKFSLTFSSKPGSVLGLPHNPTTTALHETLCQHNCKH